MKNKYTGVVTVDINGKPHKLVYDWLAISKVKTLYSKGDIINVMYEGKDTVLTADILVAGLSRHHPDITAEMIYELSPPYVPMVNAIDEALLIGYLGADEIKKQEKDKKKAKISSVLISLKKLLKMRS